MQILHLSSLLSLLLLSASIIDATLYGFFRNTKEQETNCSFGPVNETNFSPITSQSLQFNCSYFSSNPSFAAGNPPSLLFPDTSSDVLVYDLSDKEVERAHIIYPPSVNASLLKIQSSFVVDTKLHVRF